MTKTPVAFIVFNRPDLTAKVFERIRQARPEYLLVVCDGPREGVATDLARVKEVRALIDNGVDWPCKVERNYADTNMGCRQRVASGLDWVFSLVEEAIILEDDCLPDPSFFPYCEEMLARYRDTPDVMHINGTNFVSRTCSVPTSYFFTKQICVWGWATWRRAWQLYDFDMETWESSFPSFDSMFDTARERTFWLTTFNAARADPRKGDTWDFAWFYSCWAKKGLAICPQKNLVQNIGFRSDSTHTTESDRRLSIPSASIQIEAHPTKVERSRFRDDAIFRFYHNGDVRPACSPGVYLRVWKETCKRYLGCVSRETSAAGSMEAMSEGI